MNANVELKLRVTPKDKAWLEDRAVAENRSLNGQVRSILDEAMKKYPLKFDQKGAK
jgi:hypothetical protein